MKVIPEELIDQIPTDVEAERSSCQQAADAALHVLFLMGAEVQPRLNWPPIISSGIPVWPLPPPWRSNEERQVQLLVAINGTGSEEPGLLAACKRNAEEFNVAIAEAKLDVAKQIAELGPQD